MNNKKAIEWLLNAEYSVNQEARDYCITALERLEKVKFVTEEDIKNRTINNGIGFIRDVVSHDIDFARDHGILIEEEKRCRWTDGAFTTKLEYTKEEFIKWLDGRSWDYNDWHPVEEKKEVTMETSIQEDK